MTARAKSAGIQAARAIAALSVAYYHSKGLVKGGQAYPIPGLSEWGFLGVNFFFAISGYVICVVMDRPGFTVLGFVIKRIFRLWPVYIFFVALAVVLHSAYGIRMADSYDRGLILYSATLLPLKGYPFYQVSWSLEHELVFYVIAAFVVPLAGIWALVAVLAGLAAWAFFAPPSFWDWHFITTLQVDFLSGVLAYQLRSVTAKLGVIAPAVLAAGCLYALIALSVPFSGAVAWFFLLTIVLNAQLPWDRWPLRGLVVLGDASYSIYLSHWALIYFAMWWAGSSSSMGWAAEPWRFAVLGLCCLTSVALWHGFEKPSNRIGEWLASLLSQRNTTLRKPA